jgi:hypothetical protein
LQGRVGARVDGDEAQHVGRGPQALARHGQHVRDRELLEQLPEDQRDVLFERDLFGQPRERLVHVVAEQRAEVGLVDGIERLGARAEALEQLARRRVDVTAEIEPLEFYVLLGRVADFTRLEERRAAIDVAIADRARRVVGAVVAVITDHVLARSQHVGGSVALTKQARLIGRLDVVREHAFPPQRLGVARDAAREPSKQRRVSMVGAELGRQHGDPLFAHVCELLGRERLECDAQATRARVAERGELEQRGVDLLGRRASTRAGQEHEAPPGEKHLGCGSPSQPVRIIHRRTHASHGRWLAAAWITQTAAQP